MFWNKKKSTIKCSQCGEYHQYWPALAHSVPWHYSQLNAQENQEIATINDDLCEIRWKDQIDRFIRTVLIIPVNDYDHNLEYGLWVSLSEKSYNDYRINYKRTDHENVYFGWICNKLLGYEDTLQVTTDVLARTGTQRQVLELHKDCEHPLVADFCNGISRIEAETRIHDMMTNRCHTIIH